MLMIILKQFDKKAPNIILPNIQKLTQIALICVLQVI